MNDKLYEQLMHDISILVKYSINEAYDNALLEEYNFKEFLLKAIDKSKKFLQSLPEDDDIDAALDKKFLIAKKVIVNIIKNIKDNQGYKNAVIYVKQLKAALSNYFKCEESISYDELIKMAKKAAITLGFISTLTLGYIVNQAKEEYNTESIEQLELNYDSEEESIKDVETATTSGHFLKDKVSDDFGITPAKFSKENKVSMKPSTDCVDFIKEHEVLCAFPYYATNGEKNAGKITIGWGHVLCDNWKNPNSAWYFPDNMPQQRRNAIKAQVIKFAKSGKILLSKVKQLNNGLWYNANKDKSMKNTITLEEAKTLLKSDLQIADRRVKITLGIIPSAAKQFHNNINIDTNVKHYCYYNLNIYDALISCAFNSGALGETPVVENLLKCRYDFENNCIQENDFNVTMNSFKQGNGNNTSRREKEFYTFINKPGTLDNFNNIIQLIDNV